MSPSPLPARHLIASDVFTGVYLRACAYPRVCVLAAICECAPISVVIVGKVATNSGRVFVTLLMMVMPNKSSAFSGIHKAVKSENS